MIGDVDGVDQATCDDQHDISQESSMLERLMIR